MDLCLWRLNNKYLYFHGFPELETSQIRKHYFISTNSYFFSNSKWIVILVWEKTHK